MDVVWMLYDVVCSGGDGCLGQVNGASQPAAESGQPGRQGGLHEKVNESLRGFQL